MRYTPASGRSAAAHPHRREESSIKPLRIALTPALTAGLASALLFLSVLPVSAMGKSPPPEAAPPTPSAPAAPESSKPAAGAPAAQPVPGAIAVQDTPFEADRLLTVLRALEERVASKDAAVAIEARLPAMAQRISDAQLETKGPLGLAWP